jgi:HEAT repeat protein
MLKSRLFVSIMMVLAAGAAVGQTIGPATPEEVQKHIAVIKSGAGHFEKLQACRNLGAIGTKDAIEPLAALLGDEKLSHVARMALEPMPYPEVDEVFRKALGTLKGLPLVGVIGSVGVRKDAKAVDALVKFLADSDPQVVQAAARSLGRIGNDVAAKALQGAAHSATGDSQLAVIEGMFRCAETMAAAGKNDMAIRIYDNLAQMPTAHQVRAGAIRGAILTRGADGVAELKKYLASEDWVVFSAAVQTAISMKGPEVTAALTADMAKMSADKQIRVIGTLGVRGDASGLAALFAAAKSGDKAVRLAAIKTIPQIADASSVPVLVGLMADSDKPIGDAAKESLASLPLDAADAAVMKMFAGSDKAQRLTAMDLMSRRRMKAQVGELMKATQDADGQVRSAAIRRIGELGGPAQVPALLDLLAAAKEAGDLDAIEKSLVNLCTMAEKPQSFNGALIAQIAKSQPAQKSALLRALGINGGADALAAVRAATKDSDQDVHTTAIQVLGNWKGVEAAADLLDLAKNAPKPALKLVSLRSYINLIRAEGVSAEQKLAMCKEASALADRNEDKKLLLSVLDTAPSAETLAMAMSHLDNKAIQNEAGLAAVSIAEKIAEKNPAVVAEAMQKAVKATGSRQVTSRAQKVLDTVKK